jgi:hypothetical protein
VKRRFTYRELTLLAGILVALIVVFTVWLKQKPIDDSTLDRKARLVPGVVIPSPSTFLKRTFVEILF